MIPKYRQQPPRSPDEEFSPQMVISSSTELFNFYRLTLAQCAKLSPGARLVELTKVFAKYLDQYAQQILLYHISERPSGQSPSKIPPIEDVVLVLNTADYCFNTCNQLEEKIKTRIEENFRASIDLQSQADAFMGIASATVRALVRRVETHTEPVWREMRNIGWSKMESVGDQSSYVEEMLRGIKSDSLEILGMLHKQQYARAFCDNLIELIANSYLANIFQCKPISEVGAEQVSDSLTISCRRTFLLIFTQMLLDTYVLKKGFEELLTITSPPKTAPPPSYLKRVAQSMSRIDPILKTLQVRPSPPEALVQAYLIHIADKSDSNFRKILDLKGIVRRQDQTHLVDLFQAHRASPRNSALPQASPLLTPLGVQAASIGAGAHLASGLGSLSTAASVSTSNLQARFDPTTLGNAIMSAARDGVDRFGSPAIGGGSLLSNNPPGNATTAVQQQQHQQPSVPEGVGTASTTAAAPAIPITSGNINENLRNIGKFFKRDMVSWR